MLTGMVNRLETVQNQDKGTFIELTILHPYIYIYIYI